MYDPVEEAEPEAREDCGEGFEARDASSPRCGAGAEAGAVVGESRSRAPDSRKTSQEGIEMGSIDGSSHVTGDGDDEEDSVEDLKLINVEEEEDEETETRKWILRQSIVYKFCAYGFLKNLQLFEVTVLDFVPTSHVKYLGLLGYCPAVCWSQPL